MISRRSVLTISSAAIVLSSKHAAAQVVLPPNAEDVGNALKDRDQYRRVLLAVDTLRLILILRFLQLKIRSEDPAGDLARYSAIRRPFDDPKFAADLESIIFKSDSIEIIKSAGEIAKPTAARIESELEKGGVAPKGEIGSELISGFYKFTQMKAVMDRAAKPAGESWYCSIYPFSRFCRAA